MYGFHGDGDSYQRTIISIYPISTVYHDCYAAKFTQFVHYYGTFDPL